MLCSVCQKETDKMCSACKSVAYCSLEHQQAHFGTHKKFCSALGIVTTTTIKDDSSSSSSEEKNLAKLSDPLGPKFIRATRDLKQGTIIHEEDPIFCSAELNTSEKFCIKNELLCCSTCGLNMSIVAFACKCKTCGWPVCGKSDCHSHPLHAENECKIFSENKMLVNNYSLPDLMKIVNLMRVWTVKKKQNLDTKWTDLMTLFDDLQAAHNDDDGNEESDPSELSYKEIPWPADLTLDKFPCFKSQEEFDQVIDDYKKIRYLSKLKSFYVQADEFLRDPDPKIRVKPLGRTASYLFKKASHIRHSCSPNVMWSVSSYPNFKLRLRAARPIKKGDMLTVSHIWPDWDMLDGTIRRQQAFFKRYGFLCRCDRCLDPTEFGSYASAIICCHNDSGCSENEGFFLPKNPVQSGCNPDAVWICNKCQKVCEYRQFSRRIDKIFDENKKVTNTLGMIVQPNYGALVYFKGVMDGMKDFVHPNHWLMQWGARVIVTKISPGTTQTEAAQYLRLVKYLIAIDDLVMPPMSSYRAALFRYVGIAVKKRVDTIPNIVMSGPGFASSLNRLTEAVELLQYANQCLENCQKFWIKEFPPRSDAFTSYAHLLQEEMRLAKSDLANTNDALRRLRDMAAAEGYN